MIYIFPKKGLHLSVCLGSAYLAFCGKLFAKSVLKYTCILKKFEKVRKCGKKWGLKKLYIKTKS